MIQMTLIQIDNYGPWTVTPRPRTESDLQILQAELFADVQRQIAAKKVIYLQSQTVLMKKTT